MTEPLHIHMLGSFSLQAGDQVISDSDNRARKVWLILAYLLYHRGQIIPQESLCTLLWGGGGRTTNPANALKTMFHRLRTMLAPLEIAADTPIILRKGRGYTWNPDVPVELDVELFDTLCRPVPGETEEERLDRERAALSLYEGDFLPQLTSESWCIPISTSYHNLYLDTLLDVLGILTRKDQSAEVESLCRRGIKIEPYREELYQRRMRALIDLGRQGDAIQLFEEMNRLFYDNFGVLPSDETRALYREASRDGGDKVLSVQELLERLREDQDHRGPMVCDFDFFQALYQAEARRMARNGVAVHICLFTISAAGEKPLARRSLDRCMENLREIIIASLRRGDIAAQCTLSQYVVMLPQANYENSQMVCRRVIRSFQRQFPHTPAQLRVDIRPLEPA